MSDAAIVSPELCLRARTKVDDAGSAEILDWQRKRVDGPTYARTAHDGLPQKKKKKMEEDLSPTIQTFAMGSHI